jgi:hypothetical protein
VTPRAAREEVGHRSSLRLQPEPGSTLPFRRDAQVGDERRVSHAGFAGCIVGTNGRSTG